MNDFMNVLISIIMGTLLGIVLYKGFINPTIIKGPNSREVIDKVYQVNKKYYKFEPQVCASLKL